MGVLAGCEGRTPDSLCPASWHEAVEGVVAGQGHRLRHVTRPCNIRECVCVPPCAGEDHPGSARAAAAEEDATYCFHMNKLGGRWRPACVLLVCCCCLCATVATVNTL